MILKAASTWWPPHSQPWAWWSSALTPSWGSPGWRAAGPRGSSGHSPATRKSLRYFAFLFLYINQGLVGQKMRKYCVVSTPFEWPWYSIFFTLQGGGDLRVMIDIEGTLSLFSTFAHRGSSHRRKSAAWHKFDMVWLYRSPIPVGKKGVFYSLQFFLPAIAALRGRGGDQHHVGVTQYNSHSLTLQFVQRSIRKGQNFALSHSRLNMTLLLLSHRGVRKPQSWFTGSTSTQSNKVWNFPETV